MNRAGRLAALALAVVGPAYTVGGAAAQPAPAPPRNDASSAPVTWGIVPSGPDGPGDRAAFEYTVDPGSSISDVVAVSNYTEAPLTLDLYASDAVRNTSGGFDLLPAADPSVDVGSWADLGEPTVTIPARSRVDVPFRVAVPADATPGDHAGGIVASLTTRAADAAGSQVAVDRRVGARIYLRVTGTLRPELTVADLQATFAGLPLGQPGTIRVDYTVRNDGNLRLAGRPTVHVAGPFGLGEHGWTGDLLPELLPGDSITGSATVDGVWQLGPMEVDIEIQPERSGSQILDPAPPADVATTRLWVLPWITITVLAAVLGALWWRRRRRRHTARQSPAPTPQLAGVATPATSTDQEPSA